MGSNGALEKKRANIEDDFFHSFLPKVLSDSMVTGVPQIVAADNIASKLIRMSVFVTCMAGFIYQSLEFMEIYWKYETVVDVKVANDRGTEIPAFTVCNYNGLNASKICGLPEWRKKCHSLTEHPENPNPTLDLCDCYPNRWCTDGILHNHSFPERRVYDSISELDYNDIKQHYLLEEEKFFSSCKLEFVKDGDYNEDCSKFPVRCPHAETSIVNLCYTVNSMVGKPDMKPHTTSSTATFTLNLNPFRSNYPLFIPAVKAQISIHNPRTIVNPYDQGYTIPDDTRQDIRLKKVVKNLLPPPYDTKCVDYLTAWKARGGKGPINKKECFQECQKNISLREYGCIAKLFFLIPGEEKRCDSTKTVTLDLTEKINECDAKNCGPACYEEFYEVVRDQSVTGGKTCSQIDDYEEGMIVNIYLDGMEITTYTYSPKYDSIEIFSNLGGYVGMWLGISLIAVFDFLESLLIMMKYPIQKRKEAKMIEDAANLRKKRKMKNIRNIHRREGGY